MYERYANTARRFLFPREGDTNRPTAGNQVTIVNNEGEILEGVLVEKSIVIPLSLDRSSESYLNSMAEKNLSTVQKISSSDPAHRACTFLGFNVLQNINGISAGPDFFGTHVGVHLYPANGVETQKEFLDSLREVLQEKGFAISLGESL